MSRSITSQPPPDVPEWALKLLNNIYDIEQKLTRYPDPANICRNITKMKDLLEEQGLFYEDPLGQAYKETRTDLEATISGAGTDNLRVVEVIKPIVRAGKRELSRVAQKGIVVVEAKE
jgi:hypothetical protein